MIRRPPRPTLFPSPPLFRPEPYAGLDDEGSSTLKALLEEARGRGTASLVISHDRDRIAPLTPREYLLKHGVIEQVLARSEEHTSELQSHLNLVCRLLLEKNK